MTKLREFYGRTRRWPYLSLPGLSDIALRHQGGGPVDPLVIMPEKHRVAFRGLGMVVTAITHVIRP